jgi:Na+/H+-translocating membrane pyrophosphatase
VLLCGVGNDGYNRTVAIDAFGPIADNAGNCRKGDTKEVRTKDILDAGNTTAATGKGFAIASGLNC